jgi:hypothetical protein
MDQSTRRRGPHLFCRTPLARSLRYETLEDRRLLAVLTVDTHQDVVDFNDGVTSLREAIFAANTVPGADEIVFDLGDGPKKILLTQGELKITDSLTITGSGAELLTIDAQRMSRIFNITVVGSDVTLSGMKLTGGNVEDRGGAIRSSGNLKLVEMELSRNSAESGGALYATVAALGRIEILASHVLDNQSNDTSGNGGGVYISQSTSGQVYIDGGLFSRNSTRGTSASGGGLYIQGGSTELRNTTFTLNRTSGTSADGGGACIIGTNVTVTGNAFMENDTDGNGGEGGGLKIYGSGNVAVMENLFSNNSTDATTANGGGLSISFSGITGTSAEITKNIFRDNTTAGNSARGGGLHVSNSRSGSVNIFDNEFTTNRASGTNGDGGGIAVVASGQGVTDVFENLVTGNSSASNDYGLGIYARASGGARVSIRSNKLIDNLQIGERDGFGAIATEASSGGVVLVVENEVHGNSGGIVADSSGLIEINNNLVVDNHGLGMTVVAREGASVASSGNYIARNIETQYVGGGISISAIMGGSVLIDKTTVEGNSTHRNGGGIGIFVDSDGIVEIRDSTVSGNRSFKTTNPNSGDGGGLYIRNRGGKVTLSQSTISGNLADGNGGGLWVESYGESNTSLLHVTVTKNSSDSDQNGAGTGGGIAGGLVHLTNSIVAGNQYGGGSELSGSHTASYSLLGIGAQFLGPLADNGGPTKSHALLPGSPAINAGDPNAVAGANGVPEFDQRGEPFTRIFGGRIDIGAFEAQSLIVDTLVDENDGDYSHGDFSLREAIELANQIEGENTIEFASSLAGGTIQLTIGQLNVTSSINIVGLGRDLLTIDNSQTQGPIFNIDNSSLLTLATVSISDLTLTGSKSSAIRSVEDLTVDGVRIHGNTGSLGGGIRVEQGGGQAQGAKLTVRDSIFSSNHSTGTTGISSGGGISFVGRGGELRVTNSTFSENSSANRGGGLQVSVFDNLVQIVDSTFTNNMAFSGGGISINDDNRQVATLQRVTVTGNHASFAGAGIYISGKAVEILDSLISENELNAGGGRVIGGGGIYKSGGDPFTIRNTTLRGNHSDGPGGGVALQSSSLRMEDSTIHGNTTNQNGGGLSAVSGALVEIHRSTFSSNTASASGGGIYSRAVGQLIVDATSIIDNRAHLQSGGGILTQNKTTISNSLVANNWADDSGGGIAGSGEADIIQTTVSGNSAILGGGVALEGPTKVRHSTIARNIGRSSGGGINRITTNGAFSLENSLVTGNTNNLGNPDDVAGVINSTYSLIGIGEQFLAPLADNGGPTKTHALLPGSPAINAGEPTSVGGENGVPEFDQRGEPFTRVFGGRIDIGAFEAQSLVVDTLSDENDGDYSRGDFSLREAIELANQIAGENTIEFASSLASGTIFLSMGQLKITDHVQIVGLGADRLSVDAQGLSRVIYVDGSTAVTPWAIDVTVQGLTLTGGFAPNSQNISPRQRGRGGAIYFYSSGALEVVSSKVSGNSALSNIGRPSLGGGIFAEGAVNLVDSTVSNNVGDGVYAYRGSVSVLRSTVSGNNGMGLFSRRGQKVSVIQSLVTGNQGAGVDLLYGTAEITDSTISNNGLGNLQPIQQFSQLGGVGGRDVIVTRSTISGNHSRSGGGGIWANRSVTVIDSTITGNHSLAESTEFGGGGIFLRAFTIELPGPPASTAAGTLTITRSTITNNASNSDGGGIDASGQIVITDSLIAGNHALARGGGIFGEQDSKITLVRSTVDGNTAVGFRQTGAGIYSYGDVTLEYSTLSNNNQGSTAQATFGGIVAQDVILLNSTISGNGRGGIRATTIDARHSTVTRNTGTGLYAPTISLDHTIVAGNIFSNQYESDVQAQNLQAHYSQISIGGQYLGPLANNGGPTKTHVLLSGSPARDAGNSSLRPGKNGVPEFDQRGAPYTRATNRIDIGAYEYQSGILLNGDFDLDGDIDGRDFLIWQRNFGAIGVNKDSGDATGDNDVDGNDLAVWQATYDRSFPPRIVDVLIDGDDSTALQTDEVEIATAALSNNLSDVDAAFDDWPPQRRASIDFGDIATRRKALRSWRR